MKATKLVEAVKKKIQTGDWPAFTKLPSTRDLARTFGVCRDTVHTALAELEKLNLIERKKRSGVYVKGGHPQTVTSFPEITPVQPRSQQIAETIISDIVQGYFRAGSYLPAPKALQFQYRTSRVTIARALQLIAEKRLIHRRGAGYIVGSIDFAGQSRQKDKLILATNVSAHDISTQTRVGTFFTSAMNELNRYGYSKVKHIDYTMNLTEEIASIPSETLAGIFHFPLNPTAESFQAEISILLRTGKPVVLFNLYPFLYDILAGYGPRRKTVFPIYMNELAAGKASGGHLASQGHRNVAYLGLRKHEDWSRLRLQGLKSGLRDAGGNDRQVIANPENHDLYRVRSIPTTNAYLQRLLQNAISEKFENYHFKHVDVAEIVFSLVYAIIPKDICMDVIRPAMAAMLKQKDITVWVCEDAFVAEAAIQFLNKKGIRIPKDLSLFVLDDTRDCMVHGISAYTFEIERLGYLAAHCILNDIPIKRNRKGLLDVTGRIIERGTVRRL